MKKHNLIFTFLTAIVLLISCGNNDEPSTSNSIRNYGIFKVLDDDTTVEMNGEIKSTSLSNFSQLETAFPNIKTINIKLCDGSSDDEINLQLSLKVHQNGINTHLMDNGLIASGGVDFFLAGVQRTKGSNTKIGVHSWAGDNETATDFPVDHTNHLPYINYYTSIGFTQQQAEDFYYFTINAAAAEDIHWMTDAEITQYNLITN